jgi:four helix bundle protein
MENNNSTHAKPIRFFTQLHVWQEGHKLVILIHRCLKEFPDNQQYGLSNQMSRASISITSNVAEGFGRISYKEKIQFYHIAQGSLTELQNQLLVARDIGYISQKRFKEIAEQTILVHKLLSGFIKSAKQRSHLV